MKFKKELNTDFTFPNINIYNGYNGSKFIFYIVEPCDGYMLRNTESDTTTEDENGNVVVVPYYSKVAYLPTIYDFEKFPYIAELRAEDETAEPTE